MSINLRIFFNLRIKNSATCLFFFFFFFLFFFVLFFFSTLISENKRSKSYPRVLAVNGDSNPRATTDPCQVVPRQVYTPCDCILTSVAFVVLCRVGCLWVTGVFVWVENFFVLAENISFL